LAVKGVGSRVQHRSHRKDAKKLLALRQKLDGGKMATNHLQLIDQIVFDKIHEGEKKIQAALLGEVIFFYGEIRSGIIMPFRNFIEKICDREDRSRRLVIFLKTPGGSAEVVEKLVEIIRYHFDEVYFVVPDMAMSAGTIFCMSGDKIYMDYSSSLGPIDPQVPDKEDKFLIPALGYLDKVDELIGKSRNNTITPAEFALLEKQDLAMLRFYEQARELSVALLKKWLKDYKFKNWSTHRTNNPGTPVTDDERTSRAEEIAKKLSQNSLWHAHGRMIGMKTLKEELRLGIDDLGHDKTLRESVRQYSDTLCDWLSQRNIPSFLYNSHVI